MFFAGVRHTKEARSADAMKVERKPGLQTAEREHVSKERRYCVRMGVVGVLDPY
jgi:hypothetical protein